MVASGPDLRDREERVRLGALIREARVAAQLRQEDVGAACGVRAQEVSRWENASAFCRPRQVAVIARLTGKPLEFFYPGGVPGEAARADATPALQDPRLESFERRLLMVERTLLERTLLLENPDAFVAHYFRHRLDRLQDFESICLGAWMSFESGSDLAERLGGA